MARYTGPKFKLSRRLGISLSGTGKELKRPFPSGTTWCKPTEKNQQLRYAASRETKAASHVRLG